MAITIDYGYTTPTNSKNLAIYDAEYDKWATEYLKTNSVGSRIDRKEVNITSPIDRPATTQTWRYKENDVYANSGINAIYQSPLKEAVRLGHKFSSVIKITDSDSACSAIYVPMDCTITFRTGMNPNIGPNQLLECLKMTLSTMFPEGTTSTDQLARWLAGSLTNVSAAETP